MRSVHRHRTAALLLTVLVLAAFVQFAEAAVRLGQVGHWIAYYTPGEVTRDSLSYYIPATFYVQRDGSTTLYAYQYTGRLQGDGSTASVTTNGKVSTSATNGRMEIPGTATLRISRTSETRQVTVYYYIHNDTTGSDSPKASRTLTIERLARMTVEYDANGGTVSPAAGHTAASDGLITGRADSSDAVSFGELWSPAQASRFGLTRGGYVFGGWSDSPSGDGAYYDPDGSYDLTEGWDGSVDGTLRLYAVWHPIEADEAEIIVGKTVTAVSGTDTFRFRIEAIKGWHHENEHTERSGQEIPAAEVPMPEGTADGSTVKEIEITGFQGHRGLLLTESTGRIRYEYPGWYLYRLSEVLPETPEQGMKYDETSYFAVVYVEYSEAEGYAVRVRNITAWHNNAGASGNLPELSDIAALPDNGGEAAKTNDRKGVFGKVGAGINTLDAYRF